MTTLILLFAITAGVSLIWAGVCHLIFLTAKALNRRRFEGTWAPSLMLSAMVLPLFGLLFPLPDRQGFVLPDANDPLPLFNMISGAVWEPVGALPDGILYGCIALFAAYLLIFIYKSIGAVRDFLAIYSICMKAGPATSAYPGNVRITEACAPPFVHISRPKHIILPRHLLDALSRTELDMIIAHELAHIDRHDPLWFLIVELFDIVFWFNPFIRIQVRTFRVNAEVACDRAVLNRSCIMDSGGARHYAQTLLKTLKLTAVSSPDGVPALDSFNSEGDYRMRLTRILKPSVPDSRRALAIIGCSLALMAIPTGLSAAALSDAVVEASKTISDSNPAAKPIVNVNFRIPEVCRQFLGEEAYVTARFAITPEGKTDSIEIIDSSDECLDAIAYRSVSKWIYAPKIVNGRGVWIKDQTATLDYSLQE